MGASRKEFAPGLGVAPPKTLLAASAKPLYPAGPGTGPAGRRLAGNFLAGAPLFRGPRRLRRQLREFDFQRAAVRIRIPGHAGRPRQHDDHGRRPVPIQLVQPEPGRPGFKFLGPFSPSPTAAIAGTILGGVRARRRNPAPDGSDVCFQLGFGCGLLLVLIGERRLGRYVRYIPHPVIGGFLGGTGYLLLAGSYTMLTGASLGRDFFARLGAVSPLAWGTALVTAVLLTVLTRTWRHHLSPPWSSSRQSRASTPCSSSGGHSLVDARAMGLLMEPLRLGAWVNSLHFPYASVGGIWCSSIGRTSRS